jgi:hypothetical protein
MAGHFELKTPTLTATQQAVIADIMAGNDVYLAGGRHTGKSHAAIWAGLQMVKADTIDQIMVIDIQNNNDYFMRDFVNESISGRTYDTIEELAEVLYKDTEIHQQTNIKRLIIVNHLEEVDEIRDVDNIVFATGDDDILVFIENSDFWTAGKYHDEDGSMIGNILKTVRAAGANYHFFDVGELKTTNSHTEAYVAAKDSVLN